MSTALADMEDKVKEGLGLSQEDLAYIQGLELNSENIDACCKLYGIIDKRIKSYPQEEKTYQSVISLIEEKIEQYAREDLHKSLVRAYGEEKAKKLEQTEIIFE
jgi:hypothetical protein